MNTTYAIIVAAGKGTRISQESNITLPKQFFPFKGKPLWWHGAYAINKSPLVHGIVLVFNEENMKFAQAQLDNYKNDFQVPVVLALGGETRQDSVRNGLSVLPNDCDIVLIHDAARPFIETALVSLLIENLQEKKNLISGLIPALPVTDTIKHIVADIVVNTPERQSLQYVQTPQIFIKSVITAAHTHAYNEAWTVTDDASLLERLDIPVGVIEGDARNIKITHFSDLKFLEEKLMYEPVTGFGYDVHQYGGNRVFKLGTVPIPTDIMIKAHSDGDTLLHALMDALLSCIGGGDIGQHFPDNDAQYENISSALLLDKVLTLLKEYPIKITHIDLTVIAEKPKIAPHANAIRKNIAHLLNLEAHQINVKATTEEGLGFTGEMKGIKCIALVTALRKMT